MRVLTGLARIVLSATMLLCGQLATAQNEVRIGVLMPTSGAAAKSGQETLEAIKLAIDIVNGKFDIDMPFARTEGLPNHNGAKLRMITEDHGGRPERGQAIAEKMITQDKVHIIQGAFHSAVAAPASQVAEKYNIPFVTGTSESPALTERGLRTFFSVTPTANDIARDFFSFLAEVSKDKNVPLKSVAILHINDVWGSSLAQAAQAVHKNYGFDKIVTMGYPVNIADLRSEVLSLKAGNPDVILQASFDADAVLSMRTYQALQLAPKAILAMGAGFASPEFVKALGKNADFAFSHSKFDDSLFAKRPFVKKISEIYETRTGRPMWDTPARAFAATMVIADALNRAKSFSADDIIAALKATNLPAEQMVTPYRGVKFNDKGQNELANGLITQIQGGRHFPVWPKAIATREAVFPAPAWDKR